MKFENNVTGLFCKPTNLWLKPQKKSFLKSNFDKKNK